MFEFRDKCLNENWFTYMEEESQENNRGVERALQRGGASFIPELAIETLNESILHRLSWLNKDQLHTCSL